MHRSSTAWLAGTLLVAMLAGQGGAAYAAAARTFVSAQTGADGNTGVNCGPTAPCRTFGAALGVTSPGGEVVVLSSGGYGPFTVTQSVTITAPEGVYAGISVPSGAGINLNAPGIDVTLKGLTINGTGGAFGIVVNSAQSLSVERLTVSNFPGSLSDQTASGIDVGGAVELKVVDSTFNNCLFGIILFNGVNALVQNTRFLADYSTNVVFGTPGTTYSGIIVQTVDNVSTTSLTARHCYFNAGVYAGFNALPLNNTTGGLVRIAIEDSTVFGGSYGFFTQTNVAGNIVVTVADSTFDVLNFGISANGNPPFTTTVTISGSSITNMLNYALATSAGNATIYTLGNNSIANNGTVFGGGNATGNIVAVARQ